jgi:pimeloyl-ACP methyl ester carboxylesterase
MTLVLLPPLGHDARIYDDLAAALAPDVRVAALDYPLAELDPRAPDLLADLAARLLPRIAQHGPALLGGISLGATLCYLLAPRLPLRGLILMAPGGPRVATTRREGVLAAMADLGDEEFVRRHLGGDAQNAPVTCALLRAALAADLATEMGRLTARIELVWGTEDRLFNAAHIDKVRRLLPAHHFHTVDGAGHYVAREAPARVAAIVRAALEDPA